MDLDGPRSNNAGAGGMVDKGTKGKRARKVPPIAEVRPLVEARLEAVGHDPDARLFTGPRGGRVNTKVLRRATHWDEVVERHGYPHLRRHDLRHTGLTWMATRACRCTCCKRSQGTARSRQPSATSILTITRPRAREIS